MRNPYEVLGVSPSASDDEIKNAYRRLAGVYQNDLNKLDEINQAYDSIILSRNNSTNYQSTNNFTGASGAAGLGDIRAKLNAGRIDDAETLLDGIPANQRSAEWYFLKGTIQQRRGWLESAAASFERAAQEEPGNQEYRNAYENIRRARNGEFRAEKNDGCCDSPCNICSSLICADCCCECFGGDLIRCC